MTRTTQQTTITEYRSEHTTNTPSNNNTAPKPSTLGTVNDDTTDSDQDPDEIVTDHLTGVRNRNGDAWYEYDGEPLWDDQEFIQRVRDRLVEAATTEWSHVTTSPKAQAMGTTKDEWTKRVKIKTGDVNAFNRAFESKVERVADDINGWIVPELIPKPDVWEKGPKRTDVSIGYSTGHRVCMGGEAYKRQEIVKAVRDYEFYLYQTRVIEPVFTSFADRYPY